MEDSLRIMSFNILAPGLFLYFWRGSYGLRLLGDADYDAANRSRLDRVVEIIQAEAPDVLCLQETSDRRYSVLDDRTSQEYIAARLGYEIVSEASKDSPFFFSYPPHEQQRILSMDSGVCTLVNPEAGVKHVATVSTVNDYTGSNVFATGAGSPFVVDEFSLGALTFHVVNLHVRMA